MGRLGRRFSVAAVLLSLLLGGTLVLAQDVIHRTDGGRLRGRIVGEDRGSVTIETAGGRYTVPRGQISRIEREGDVYRELERRRGALDAYDAAAWYGLGTWCLDQGLYPEAIDCFHTVVGIDRNHADARWELGYRKLNGRWVTEADYYRARGYARWRDRWVPEQDLEKLEQGLVYQDGHWVTPEQLAQAEAARPRDSAPPRRAEPERERDEEGRERARRAPAQPWQRQGGGLGGQAGQPRLSDAEREAQLQARKQQGGWKVAYPSKYYDFFSNGPEEEVRTLAAVMDLMCEEFVKIFKHDQELTRPFPVLLYGSQQEFMSQTGQGPGTGGFYDGEKIVGFHGQLGNLSTQSVLFHEGTHQFQGLVMGRNMWKAKIWLIEGLAVFFEASEVQGRRLATGAIPQARLAHVKRAIQSGSHVPLRDLIRMEQAQFGALHYAHAWSLIYFLVNGAGGGKKRFVEYWERTKVGDGDPVAMFEELFNRPIEEIEAAWKEYVLRLQ